MELYALEKNRFSQVQGSFHRLLNTIKNLDNIDTEIEFRFMEINDMIDKLNYSIHELNENIIMNSTSKNLSKELKLKIKNIENDNMVIRNLIPIALMYRMSLSP